MMARFLIIPLWLGLFGCAVKAEDSGLSKDQKDLFRAIDIGDLEHLEELLRDGVDWRCAREGRTPLMLACELRDIRLIRALVELGVDPMFEYRTETAMSYARDHLHSGVVMDALIEMGVPRGDVTELEIAILVGDVERMERAGRNLVGMAKGDDRRYVAQSMHHGRPRVLLKLIQLGAHHDFSEWEIAAIANATESLMQSRDNTTHGDVAQALLALATIFNSDKVVSWLLDQGVVPSSSAKRGSALFLALHYRRLGLFEKLLSAGADPDEVVPGWGVTVYQVARRTSDKRYIELVCAKILSDEQRTESAKEK